LLPVRRGWSPAAQAWQKQIEANRAGIFLNTFIHRFATPLTTGLFLISAVSGFALFFRWAPGAFHSMHEWLSVVLLLPFLLHAWKNWSSLVNYAKRGTLLIPLLLCLVVAVPFAMNSMKGNNRGNAGLRGAIPLLTQAHLSDLAPILKTTPDALLAKLKQRGFKADAADQTIDTIASAAGKPPGEVLSAVMPPPAREGR
jgi:hypothetical protein